MQKLKREIEMEKWYIWHMDDAFEKDEAGEKVQRVQNRVQNRWEILYLLDVWIRLDCASEKRGQVGHIDIYQRIYLALGRFERSIWPPFSRKYTQNQEIQGNTQDTSKNKNLEQQAQHK